MTKLSAIDGHLIWIECSCGHHASLQVSDLLMGLSAEKKGRSGRGVGAVRIMRQTRRCKVYADRL
jgi:hypothetical protein